MVFTLDEMKLLQAIHNKSPSEYTEAEKIIVKNICDKNKTSKIKQQGYYRKYLQTEKGRASHRRASKRYYEKKKAERLAMKEQIAEQNKKNFENFVTQAIETNGA